MPKKKTVPGTEVSRDELVSAALNTPDEHTVKIGGKDFILKDFKYKDFLQFTKYLAPMLDLFFVGKPEADKPKLDTLAIIDFCDESMPKMGLLVAHHTYPNMTEDELLELVPSPFELAELVLSQVAHNRIIERLTGFLQLANPKRTV